MTITLSSVTHTKRNTLPPRVVVHGAQKVGKSTFAAGAYKPIFLPLEDGLSGLEVAAFPLLRSFDEVMQALTALTHPTDFATVVIDSLDWLEPLIWAHTCKVNGWKSIEQPGYGKGYQEANAYWRQFFDALNDLRVNHGKAIVLIAHSQVKRFESPDSEAFDRYELKLQKGPLGIAVEWADIIGYACEETQIKKESVGINNVRSRGMSTGRRVLHVNSKPAFIAGNRYGMPDTVDLTWSALVAAMATPAAAEAA